MTILAFVIKSRWGDARGRKSLRLPFVAESPDSDLESTFSQRGHHVALQRGGCQRQILVGRDPSQRFCVGGSATWMFQSFPVRTELANSGMGNDLELLSLVRTQKLIRPIEEEPAKLPMGGFVFHDDAKRSANEWAHRRFHRRELRFRRGTHRRGDGTGYPSLPCTPEAVASCLAEGHCTRTPWQWRSRWQSTTALLSVSAFASAQEGS